MFFKKQLVELSALALSVSSCHILSKTNIIFFLRIVTEDKRTLFFLLTWNWICYSFPHSIQILRPSASRWNDKCFSRLWPDVRCLWCTAALIVHYCVNGYDSEKSSGTVSLVLLQLCLKDWQLCKRHKALAVDLSKTSKYYHEGTWYSKKQQNHGKKNGFLS